MIAPDLDAFQARHLAAFWELSTCRNNSMAAGPIPWDVMDRYAMRAHLDETLYDDFMFILREMDEEFLKFHAEKMEREKRDADGKAGRFRATPARTR